MQPRSSFAHILLGASLVVLVACSGGEGASPPGADASTGTPDAPKPPPDGPAALTCAHTRTLPTYPWGVTVGAFFPDRRMTFGILADSTSTAGSRLVLELWPGAGGVEPTIPTVQTLSTSDTYANCQGCLLLGEGCTTQPNQCRTYYFAQAGTLYLNQAGRSEANGKLRANGTNVTFREWSMTADAPVPNGRCITVTSVKIDAEWGDGGTCSGDPCGAGCCSDSPYCSLGNNATGRFCSDYCGEGGDGCTGPNDCCDGYRCFLGSCIVDGCGANACTQGFDEGGGCCDQAPYCVAGRCGGACGMAGNTCGGNLDCCTGLSCNAGTCG